MAATVASITPASRPRQPAWATPITPARLSKATGTQSAVCTASTRSGSAVTSASASVADAPGRALSAVAVTTSAPWTWRSHTQGWSATPGDGAASATGSAPMAKSPSGARGGVAQDRRRRRRSLTQVAMATS